MPDEHTCELNRRSLLKTAGIAGAMTSLGGFAAATPGRQPGPKESEVLVGVSAATDDLASVVAPHLPDRAAVAHENRTLGYVAVTFPSAAPDAARERFVEAITDVSEVKYAESNTTHHALYTPNDPRYSDQYVPQQVGADIAWDTTLGDCSCTIAVIDTGIQYDHPDLDYCANPVAQRDFVDGDANAYPDVLADEYHGTTVAGVAAANTDNGEGIAGIADAGLLAARALDENGSGSTADIADAIEWAADQGATVINLSIGGGGYTQTMKNAVSYAYDQGSLLVGAAGGSATSGVAYPAAYSEVIAVSAVDASGNLASFSSYGPKVELCAPGVNVLTTTTTDRGSYESLSGTSFATAVVSGVAALTCARWGLSNTELRRHLKATATDLGLSPSKQGCGQVDAAAAVDTDPATSGSCGGGTCGARSFDASVTDSLSSYSDSDCWTWTWNYANPCEVVIELSGPSTADFDLYASEGTTTCPTTSNYDHRSWTTTSQEQIVISNPDTSTNLQLMVDSWKGSGSYTLTVTEKAL